MSGEQEFLGRWNEGQRETKGAAARDAEARSLLDREQRGRDRATRRDIMFIGIGSLIALAAGVARRLLAALREEGRLGISPDRRGRAKTASARTAAFIPAAQTG